MSFILKALKKLENEKASHKMESVEINSAILTPDRRSSSIPRYARNWFLVSLLIIIVAITILFVRPKTPSQVAGEKSPSSLPLHEVKSSPPPRMDERPSSQVIPVVNKEIPVTDSPVIHTQASALKRHGQRRKMLRERISERPSVKNSMKLHHPEAELQLSAAPSSLIVNGIALQDDPSQSIAVVNGQIVKKGMSIAGSRIERIFLDKVRFRGDNGIFEVYMSK
jgi:general secretion pathway protein B